MQNEIIEKGIVFQLRDGNTIIISDRDAQDIASKIMVQHIIDNKVIYQVSKDSSIERAEYLRKVMEQEKEMKEEMKEAYYGAILRLINQTT